MSHVSHAHIVEEHNFLLCTLHFVQRAARVTLAQQELIADSYVRHESYVWRDSFIADTDAARIKY